MILAPPAPAKTHSAGPPAWDPIVNALRDELGEYGGLVRLYDEQQKQISGLVVHGGENFRRLARCPNYRWIAERV